MDSEVERLATALRRQRQHLATLIDHPARDESDFHIAVAAIMRAMLCDGEHPTLIDLGRKLLVDMRVWARLPPSAKNQPPPGFLMFGSIVSLTPVNGAYEMDVADFLDAPIGSAITTPPGVHPAESKWYTPKMLIKWTANKEGSAHFDPKPKSELVRFSESVTVTGNVSLVSPDGYELAIAKNDDFRTRAVLLELAQMSRNLADRTLAQHDSTPE